MRTDGTIGRAIGALFAGGTAAGLTDDELLDRFVARRAEAREATVAAEAAFAAMVHRHGPMVLGVCRQALRDPRDVEDAFQATFLVLARRAGAVRPGGNLGRFLYGVARRVAARVRAESARRRSREDGPAPEVATDPEVDAHRADLRESLDAELVRLPEKYRAAIVLCHLEGLSVREAAERLGCPTGTVCVRLARGRGLLKERLIRRGIAPAVAAGLASTGPIPEAMAATRALIDSTIRLATASGSAGGDPARAVALAEEVLRAMSFTRPKIVAGIALALLVAVGTGVRAQQKDPARPPRDDAPPVLLARFDPQPEPAPDPDPADEDRTPYPIELKPDKVYESPGLAIEVRGIQIRSGPVVIVPIECSKGITGAVILGDGTFRFAPEGAKPIEGHFRAAMLRINPADQAKLVPLDAAKRVTDRAAFEMSRHLLNTVFGHCWHSGKDALIPPVGNLSAVLYSKEHGDLLISDDGKNSVAHSFTARKTLYEKK